MCSVIAAASCYTPCACCTAVEATGIRYGLHQQQTSQCAARCNTWLLINLTLKGVVFSLLFSQCAAAVQRLGGTGATAADGLGGEVTYLVWMVDSGHTLTPMSALPGSSTCQLEMVALLFHHSCTDGLRLHTKPCQSCCQAVLVEGFVGAPVHNPLHPSHPNAQAQNLTQHRATCDQIDVEHDAASRLTGGCRQLSLAGTC